MEPSPTANFLCVKKGFKNPEAIVKMLNMENDMARGFMEGGTEAMKEYKDLGTNWVAQYPTGDINIEYFDEFVEQWKVLGGDVLTGEVQEVVDSQK